MRLFILALLVHGIGSCSLMASNWMPISKIQSLSVEAHQLEKDCLKSGEVCFDVGNEPQAVKEGFVSIQDEYFTKNDVEECTDESDCQSRHENKTCSDELESSVKNTDLLQVYCSKKIPPALIVDNSGWNDFKATELAKVQSEAALSEAKRLRECGGRVMDLMLVRNVPKQLSTAQVKQLVSTYSSIKGLLESGSLVSAKEEILLVTADEVLVTEADKLALAFAIDECLGDQ